MKRSLKTRIVMGIIIMLGIIVIHLFRFGTIYSGKAYIFYYSYASDILLPVGVYFILSMSEISLRFLGKWYTKALIVFGFMSFSEILQIFGIYFFGVTFDPIDFLMFAIGVMIAVSLDKLIFEKLLRNWKY